MADTKTPTFSDKGDNHCFLPHEGSRKLVIFLSATGTKPGKFNMWKLAGDIPHNRLYLSQRANNWYQSGVPGFGADLAGTIAAIKALIAAHGITEVYTLGSSMGGHGAILYATHLNAQALAFGAETIMRLPFSKSAKMMPVAAPVGAPDLSPLVAASPKTVFLYSGEMDPVDIFCASKVMHLPNVRVKTVRAVGHAVISHLVATDRLLPLVNAFINDQPHPGMEEQGSACETSGFADAYYEGWRLYTEKKNEQALPLLERAVALYPLANFTRYLLAMTLIRLLRFADALPHAAMAAALAPNDAEHQFAFAHCLRKNDQPEHAIYLYRQILHRWPSLAKAHYDMALLLRQQGFIPEAQQAMDEAARLQPDNATYQQKAKATAAKTLLDRIRRPLKAKA